MRAARRPGLQFRFGTTDISVTHPDATAVLADVGTRLRAGQGFALATINWTIW